MSVDDTHVATSAQNAKYEPQLTKLLMAAALPTIDSSSHHCPLRPV